MKTAWLFATGRGVHLGIEDGAGPDARARQRLRGAEAMVETRYRQDALMPPLLGLIEGATLRTG